jgi:hypothetical protein
VEALGLEWPPFGFGPHRKNFGHGNFRRANGGTARLSTEQYRMLLRLRYYKLISRGTPREVNAFMRRLFPESEKGRVFVLDPLDMTWLVYVFAFNVPSWACFVLRDMDALPRPAGVGVELRVLAPKRFFGFGKYHYNFCPSGVFAPRRRRSFGLGAGHLNFSGTFAS